MPDKRNWFRKFLDQTSFGDRYNLYLTPEQAEKALSSLSSRSKSSGRIRGLIEELEGAAAYPTIVNQQPVVTITLDTSDTITLQDELQLTKKQLKEVIQSVVVETGLYTRTTRV